MRLSGGSTASQCGALPPPSPALSERPQFSMARGEPCHLRLDSGRKTQLKRSRPRPFEKRHSLPETIDRPTIVALGMVGKAEAEVASACRTTSPPAVASARVRWPEAMAWNET